MLIESKIRIPIKLENGMFLSGIRLIFLFESTRFSIKLTHFSKIVKKLPLRPINVADNKITLTGYPLLMILTLTLQSIFTSDLLILGFLNQKYLLGDSARRMLCLEIPRYIYSRPPVNDISR